MDFEKYYLELQDLYLDSKQLIEVVKLRYNDCYPAAILNELRAFNDHMARCFLDGMTPEQKERQLQKAEGHLKRLRYDCYKHLNVYFCDYISAYEKNYNSKWSYADKGNFWGNYCDRYSAIIDLINKAKEAESKNPDKAPDLYEEAFNLEEDLYEYIERFDSELKLSKPRRFWHKINSILGWFVVTLLSIILPNILHGLWVNRVKILDGIQGLTIEQWAIIGLSVAVLLLLIYIFRRQFGFAFRFIYSKIEDWISGIRKKMMQVF